LWPAVAIQKKQSAPKRAPVALGIRDLHHQRRGLKDMTGENATSSLGERRDLRGTSSFKQARRKKTGGEYLWGRKKEGKKGITKTLEKKRRSAWAKPPRDLRRQKKIFD